MKVIYVVAIPLSIVDNYAVGADKIQELLRIEFNADKNDIKVQEIDLGN